MTIHELSHSYVTRSLAILRAVESHQEWIEGRLGVPLSEAVILQTEYGFHNAAIRRLIGYIDTHAPVSSFRARSRRAVQVSRKQMPRNRLATAAIEDREPLRPEPQVRALRLPIIAS